MPLPPHALAITGACNCRSISYRIIIPPLHDRPLHPNYDPNSGLSPIHQPYVFLDHCNDCRRATGSVIPAWISGPLEHVSVFVSNSPSSYKSESELWHNAKEVVTGRNKLNDGKLSFYNSSPGRYRSFCTTCGTHLFYWEEQSPETIDVVLGTVDRQYLESENLIPERHMWWNLGLSWMKDLLVNGDGGQLELHVSSNMNERY